MTKDTTAMQLKGMVMLSEIIKKTLLHIKMDNKLMFKKVKFTYNYISEHILFIDCFLQKGRKRYKTENLIGF